MKYLFVILIAFAFTFVTNAQVSKRTVEEGKISHVRNIQEDLNKLQGNSGALFKKQGGLGPIFTYTGEYYNKDPFVLTTGDFPVIKNVFDVKEEINLAIFYSLKIPLKYERFFFKMEVFEGNEFLFRKTKNFYNVRMKMKDPQHKRRDYAKSFFVNLSDEKKPLPAGRYHLIVSIHVSDNYKMKKLVSYERFQNFVID